MNEDKELEEAIKTLKKFCEYDDNLFLQDEKLYEYQDAKETVLQELKKTTEERDIYKEEHDKITKVLNLKEGSLNPPVELIIEGLKKSLENSIPKKKIKDKKKN